MTDFMSENNTQTFFQGIWELVLEILKDDLPPTGEIKIISAPEFYRLEIVCETPKKF